MPSTIERKEKQQRHAYIRCIVYMDSIIYLQV